MISSIKSLNARYFKINKDYLNLQCLTGKDCYKQFSPASPANLAFVSAICICKFADPMQSCRIFLVVFRNVLDEGGLERPTVLPDKLRDWVRVCRTPRRMKWAIL